MTSTVLTNEVYEKDIDISNINLDNYDSDEEIDFEEMHEIKINGIVKKMKHMFHNAKYRSDYDNIIKIFNIKIIKNGREVSPISLKMDIKKKIISFNINEPEDIFNYDIYMKK